MGIVSSYSLSGAGVAGAVPATQYLGATSQVGHVAVGGRHIVSAVDWNGSDSEEVDDFVWQKPEMVDVVSVETETVAADDDPELPDWVEEEYGGLHTGIENADISAEEDYGMVMGLPEPVVAKRGRPKKVLVS